MSLLIGLSHSHRSSDGLASWNRSLNSETGLWQTGDGGDKPVSETRRQTDYLLAAAEAGVLDKIPFLLTLESLSEIQDQEGSHAGNYRWNAHEPAVSDGNAAFFTTLPLLALRESHADALGVEGRSRIDALLNRSYSCFEKKMRTRNFFYPNAYMGDLICAYLIAAQTGRDTKEAVALLDEAAVYYRDQDWGWGEHLSDIYAKVCQDAISLLLVLGTDLPQATRAAWTELLHELNAIDTTYAGGPRVPAIRNYAFEAPPQKNHIKRYIDLVRPVDGFPAHYMAGFRAWLHRKGWYKLIGELQPASIPIPAHGKSKAFAIIQPGWRMGVMSRYPIMENLDNQTAWGLGWQSMPFALWSEGGDWGFLQWMVEDPGGRTAHPAESRHSQPIRSLGTREPFGEGITYGSAIPDGFVILRVMEEIPPHWETLTDRFFFMPGTSSSWKKEAQPGQWELQLSDKEASRLRVGYVPLGSEIREAVPDADSISVSLDLRTVPRTHYSGIWIFEHLGEG